MGRAEAPRGTFLEPLAIAEARKLMPSMRYACGPGPDSDTVLFLPGGSRSPNHYEGPPLVSGLAEQRNVIAVGYPYQEERSREIIDQSPQRGDFAGAAARAAEAIELLDKLQSGKGTLHIVAKSGGSMFTLAYLRDHPEISARTVLTVLGLPFDKSVPQSMAFDMQLQGLTIIQGERDQYFTPESAREYVTNYKDVLGCEPVVIGVKGDHSFRGENQDKNNFDVLPEHLPEVLEILRGLSL